MPAFRVTSAVPRRLANLRGGVVDMTLLLTKCFNICFALQCNEGFSAESPVLLSKDSASHCCSGSLGAWVNRWPGILLLGVKYLVSWWSDLLVRFTVVTLARFVSKGGISLLSCSQCSHSSMLLPVDSASQCRSVAMAWGGCRTRDLNSMGFLTASDTTPGFSIDLPLGVKFDGSNLLAIPALQGSCPLPVSTHKSHKRFIRNAWFSISATHCNLNHHLTTVFKRLEQVKKMWLVNPGTDLDVKSRYRFLFKKFARLNVQELFMVYVCTFWTIVTHFLAFEWHDGLDHLKGKFQVHSRLSCHYRGQITWVSAFQSSCDSIVRESRTETLRHKGKKFY